jgi:GT2 family glycosyltransferase
MPYPKVDIIILNWNGLKDTLECLESCFRIDYPNFEVIVVDNASLDGSSEKIKKEFPRVIFLQNSKNLGFAEGNNVGMRYSMEHGADFIFLLNNDTVVDPQSINKFLETARLYPQGGIFAAKIYYYKDPKKIWFAGGRWNKDDMNFEHIGMGTDDSGQYDHSESIDYACGCAMLIKREVLEKIGYFDKIFYLTFEETDYCYRARKAGYESIFVPNAKIWHKVSASFNRVSSSLYTYYMTRNLLLWGRRYLHRLQFLRLYKRTFMKALFLQHGIFEKRNPQVERAKVLGLRDYFLGRFGPCSENFVLQ